MSGESLPVAPELNFLNERILVTGATGFVGNHLVRKLHEQGFQVRCLVRPTSIVSRLVDLGIEVTVGDIFDIKAISNAVENTDVIFHLVGGGGVSTVSSRGLAELRELNVLSLKNVLEIVKDKLVKKVVHFSSISAMGVQKGVKLTENSYCKPITPHEVAKRESEELALEYSRNLGIPVTILRPSQIYGPGDTKSEILKIARLVKKHLFPLVDGGAYYMPWVYVDDVVDCAIRAMLFGKPGEIYNVSDKMSYTLKDIVEEIAKNIPTANGGIYIPKEAASLLARAVEIFSEVLGIEPFFTTYRIESITSNRFVSIDKATKELAYEPKINLDTGIRRTVEWYKHEGFL